MEICCVIPASEVNRYSKNGDMEAWGDTTLLEWKLSQIKEVIGVDRIIISTSSEKIAMIGKTYNVEVVHRSPKLSLSEMYRFIADAVGDNHVLLTNPTAPFLSPKKLNALIDKYLKNDHKNDGIITVRKIQDYLIGKSNSFNFKADKKAFSRTELEPMYIITNGAYLIPAKSMNLLSRPFGINPMKFEVNWLESLEIRDTDQMMLFPSLLSKYFEGEF